MRRDPAAQQSILDRDEISDREHAAAMDVLFMMAGALILAAGAFGGASRENPLRLAAVELCALPVAALALRRMALGWTGRQNARSPALPLTILSLILAVPLLQLTPLPPALWTALPGQGPRLDAIGQAHLAAAWLPVTLAPRETAGAAMALLPPAAMLAGAICLTPGQTRRLSGLWILLGAAGLILGAAQIAAPDGGRAYLYRTTNTGSLVGLFANRNHEAGFLLALTPLAAALAIRPPPSQKVEGRRMEGRQARGRDIDPLPWLIGAFMLMAVVALGVIRSRAGAILAGPAVLAALAVLWRGARARPGWKSLAMVAAAAMLAILAVTLISPQPILDRFGRNPAGEFRFAAWPYVAAAARTFPLLGSGMGAFDRVFEAIEPLAFVAPTYFNHAHNDFLELALESGAVGMAILGLFTTWLAWSTWRAWRSGSDLARAASAAIVLLMTQSVVDYPLRTETLAVLLAFCCAILARQSSRNGER
jgi:O-antigen ligase